MSKMVIVVGPSGAGKSSFLEKALREIPNLVDTVTYTTRAMRKGESEGHPYHFVTEERFQELIRSGFFLEWAKVHTSLYGTPKHQIDDAWKAGQCVIMDVDVQGARTIKGHYPESLTVFILPPSIDVLRQRIQKRDGGHVKDLEVRMANAVREMGQARDFDVQIVNDDFAASYAQFKKIVEEFLRSE